MAGNGTFNQSGGTVNVNSGGFFIGYQGNGTYHLSGGSLSAGNETLGEIVPGTFVQTGGIHMVGTPSNNGTMYIGVGGGVSSYSISGSSSTLTVNGGMVVGYSYAGADGVLNIAGGNTTVTGGVVVYGSPGSAINLSAGSFSVDNLSTSGSPSLQLDGRYLRRHRFQWINHRSGGADRIVAFS